MSREMFEKVRDSYKRLCEGSNPQPGKIIHMITEAIGLTDANGRLHRDTRTNTTRLVEKRSDGKPVRPATDFAPGMLAEAIIGPRWKEELGFDNDNNTIAIPRMLRFMEAGSAPIGPSAFMNVAAWSGAVSGLMRAEFSDGYQQAKYDLLGLFPTRTPVNWQGGERFIDIVGPAEPAPEVGIAEEHKDMSMSAMWVEPAGMKKYGGKIEVARETAAIDISGGQLLAKARTGGDTLAFRENELILDILVGTTNNFKLGFLKDTSATGYNTYGPTITRPDGSTDTIPNDNVNPLNDIGALQKSDEYIANLNHPLTGNPIEVEMNTVILPTPLRKWGQWMLGIEQMTGMTQTTAGPAQAAPGTFPNMAVKGANPWQYSLQPRESRWLHYRHKASTTATSPNRSPGLGLTGAALYRWYRLDPNRFAARRCMWEANVIDLNPGDYQMAVQNIIAGQVFNIAVMMQVLNPWAIQRNKGS